MGDMPIINIKNLEDNEYTITAYEKINTRYGNNYVITALPKECEIEFRFYSNSYLTTYINTYSPNKKFKISVSDSKIKVDGYNRKTVLH
jgi:hypothetical protein